MKSFLSLLGAFSLSLTAGISIAANISVPNIVQDAELPYDLTYRKILTGFRIARQAKRNYCGPAAAQNVILFLNNNSPGQYELAIRLGADSGCGTNPNRFVDTLNSLLPNHAYYSHFLPRNFGQNLDELLIFQDAVTHSLQQNIPAILGFTGEIPWMSTTGGHVVPITGIEVNRDPEQTRYQIAESARGGVNGEFYWFTANQLRRMFTQSGGGLFLPSHHVFDFVNSRIHVWVEYASNGTFHAPAPPEGEHQNEYINLLSTAGIDSLNTLQFAKSITLPQFSIHYNWKDRTFSRTKLVIDPKTIVENTGWKKDEKNSVNWRDASGNEANVELKMKQTFVNSSKKLELEYIIRGNGSVGGIPYVDFNMGSYWWIDFKAIPQ